MITPVRAVSGSEHTVPQRAATQNSRPPAPPPHAAPGTRVVTGAPRPLPPRQPNGDPCPLTLWGTEEN